MDGTAIIIFIIGIIFAFIYLQGKSWKIINLIYVLNFMIVLVISFISPSLYEDHPDKIIQTLSIIIILYLTLILNGWFLTRKQVINPSTNYFNNILILFLLLGSAIKIIVDNFYTETNNYYIVMIVIYILMSIFLKKALKKYDKK